MSFEEWKEYNLRELCSKIGSGATPKGGKESYLEEGEIALIRSQNVLDFSFSYDGLAFINADQANKLDNVTVEEEDVLLNITGDSVARVCKPPKEVLPARVNQHVAILRSRQETLDSDFLKYYLLNPSFKNFMLGLSSVGGTRNALTKGMIEDFRLNIPPLSTQRQIASILSSLDEKIELARQTNQTLEAIAAAIFKEWFVDFNFPGATGEMQESELGEIPKGWRVGRLGELTSRITKGTTPTTQGEKFQDKGINFLRVDCISASGEINSSKALFISEETHSNLKRSQLQEFDILVTIAGSIGRIGIVTERVLPANTNQAIGIIRANEQLINSRYLYYILKQKKTLDALLSGITQSVQANISLSDLGKLNMLIPTGSLLNKYDEVATPLLDKIEVNILELETLVQLRDSLLPKLMKGEIPLAE